MALPVHEKDHQTVAFDPNTDEIVLEPSQDLVLRYDTSISTCTVNEDRSL